VHQQRQWYSVNSLCRIVHVSRAGYYSWLHSRRKRELSDGLLLKDIKRLYQQSNGRYGSPRVYRGLRTEGRSCSKSRVERLMRDNDLRAKHKRKFEVTTDSKHSLPVADNILARRFEWERPNQAWVGDITYIRTDEGWLYLAMLLD